MRPGQVVCVHGERYALLAAVDVSPETAATTYASLPVHSPMIGLMPRNLIHSPTLDADLDCSFPVFVRCNHIDEKVELIPSPEFKTMWMEASKFLQRIKAIPAIEELKHIRHELLPLLVCEFDGVDGGDAAARSCVVDRLKQMFELLDVLIAVAETSSENPRAALKDWVLPVKPSKVAYDPSKLRHFYGGAFALTVLGQLTEELGLYCRCNWITTTTQPTAIQSLERLALVWDWCQRSHATMNTMLMRLPPVIRDEICWVDVSRQVTRRRRQAAG